MYDVQKTHPSWITEQRHRAFGKCYTIYPNERTRKVSKLVQYKAPGLCLNNLCPPHPDICAIFTPFLLKNLQHHMISIINCPVRPLLQEWDVWKSVAKPGQGKQKNNCKILGRSRLPIIACVWQLSGAVVGFPLVFLPTSYHKKLIGQSPWVWAW